MKVLVYIDKIPVWGGSNVARDYIIKALNTVGVETTEDPNDTYDIVDINLFVGKVHKVCRYCNKHNIPVVVHGHWTTADMSAHSFKFWKLLRYTYFKPTMYSLYKKADLAIPVSKFAYDTLEPDLIYYPTPMKVIPNALDISEFSENKEAKKLFEEKFNIKPTDKVVINAASVFERKGFPDFIEVARRNPDIKFFWFGTKYNFLYSHKMTKLYKKLPSNMYMPGRLRNEIFFGAFQRADCVFFPSFVETDGYVLLEAMASKTPALVRDIRAYEWVTDGVHCFKGKNVDEFDKLLHYILENDTSKVVKAAYEKVHERDLVVIGTKLKETYEKLIEEKKAGK